MKIPFCPHEERVAELVTEGRWPWAADPGLLRHAEKCSCCCDVVSTLNLLQQGRSATMLAAHAGSPYDLWWRAQLRRRTSIVDQITKPLVWAQRIALLCMVCVAAGFVVLQQGQIRDWISRLADNFGSHALGFSFTYGGSLMLYSIVVGLAAVACLCGFTLFMPDGKK
jgi:hypothetical protein